MIERRCFRDVFYLLNYENITYNSNVLRFHIQDEYSFHLFKNVVEFIYTLLYILLRYYLFFLLMRCNVRIEVEESDEKLHG